MPNPPIRKPPVSIKKGPKPMIPRPMKPPPQPKGGK